MSAVNYASALALPQGPRVRMAAVGLGRLPGGLRCAAGQPDVTPASTSMFLCNYYYICAVAVVQRQPATPLGAWRIVAAGCVGRRPPVLQRILPGLVLGARDRVCGGRGASLTTLPRGIPRSRPARPVGDLDGGSGRNAPAPATAEPLSAGRTIRGKSSISSHVPCVEPAFLVLVPRWGKSLALGMDGRSRAVSHSRLSAGAHAGIRLHHSAGMCGGALLVPRAADLPAGRGRDLINRVGHHVSAWQGDRAGGVWSCLLLPGVPFPGVQRPSRSAPLGWHLCWGFWCWSRSQTSTCKF